jgi:signal recognition particle subunit SRP54
MFDNLQEKMDRVFKTLRGEASLNEWHIENALKEIRVALLEADVHFKTVKDFTNRVKEKANGSDVLTAFSPAQQVTKIVRDELQGLLGGNEVGLALVGSPAVIMMVGLQGSGKTTTCAKLALRLRTRERKRVLLASLDVQRPAAQEQLATLARQVEVESLPIVPGQPPLQIADRAIDVARREGYDVVILDTAGRLHIDDELMAELEGVRERTRPRETLLVADALTGQDAVNVARAFHERIGIDGIVLTRMDGDARGGAALSMRSVTGQPIKLAGMGERLDALEAFHPDRVASRILGMGDVVSLVERVAETVDREEAEKLAAKMKKGSFDLEDLATQLKQMRKMGGMSGLLGMLPGIGKLKQQMAGDSRLDDGVIVHQLAIIGSMTPKERRAPQLLHASRKRRIAAGSGTSVQEVNKLLKQYQQMQIMMKRVKKMGHKQFLSRGLPPGLLGP